MKNIPVFTTQFGSASLILQEIPYRRTAYVLVRHVYGGGLRDLLDACGEFCFQAGAETVFVSAEPPPDFLPHVHDMLELFCHRDDLPQLGSSVTLEPVTAEHEEWFRQNYNRLFRGIPNAATCTAANFREFKSAGGRSYMALLHGTPVGFGQVLDNELCSIGILPEYQGRRLGWRLTLALLGLLDGPEYTLKVSSANRPAMRLYEKLGFQRKQLISSWYLNSF